MRRQSTFIYTLALPICLGLVFLSCSPREGPSSKAAYIDEAFARLFPEAADFLAERPGLLPQSEPIQDQNNGSAAVKTSNYSALTELSADSENLLQRWKADASAPKVLIASPLAAAKLIQAAAVTNVPALPHLVVPLGRSSGLSGFDYWSIEYDYPAAYAELGRKAAALLKKKRAAATGQAGDYCLVIFQENLLRGKEALEAFSLSFGAEAGEAAMKIELLSDTASLTDIRGAFEQTLSRHLGTQASENPSLVVLGIDDAFAAEEAARGKLGASESSGAPSPLFLADCGSWGGGEASRKLYAWRIEADGRKLGNKAFSLARKIEGDKTAALAVTIKPPDAPESAPDAADAAQTADPGEERIILVPLRLLALNSIF